MKRFIKSVSLLALTMVAVAGMSVLVSAKDLPTVTPVPDTGVGLSVDVNYTEKDTLPQNKNYCGAVIPVKVDRKCTVVVKRGEGSSHPDFYADENFETSLTSNNVNGAKGECFEAPKAGTYYVVFNDYIASSKISVNTKVEISSYTDGETTMINNFNRKVGFKQGTDKVFKYTATQTGVLTIATNIENEDYRTIYDAANKMLSAEARVFVSNTNGAVVENYAVKKGKTYKFAIYSGYSTSYGEFNVFSSFSKVNDTNKKKKKAVKISKKNKAGVLPIGDSSAKWYKFKWKKKKTWHINIALSKTGRESTNGTVYATIYRGKKKVKNGKVALINNRINKIYTLFGKVKKGTYYVKISKTKKNTSAVVNINVK